MPTLEDMRFQCHCLTSHLSHGMRLHEDIFTFEMKSILRKLFTMWPDRRFIGIPFAQYRDYYLEASNAVATERLRARGMNETDIADALAKRKCGGCGFHSYRMLRDEPETVHLHMLQEAA
ncbi:MAG: hypothetical protein DI628_03200 [Blastochloris viridis]|uniref:Uncharacterized protein n=1 Tax=Blastochloris viridis TaxID=1079 RepID=A0A6N4REX7_BLAVI|nr:MAG: hypothetical protein DI628_03200 [Blastochloris viridis]